MNEELRVKISQKINFIIVALVSLVGMGIIPFLSASINMDSDEEIIQTAFPHSTLGWIMWAVFRLMIIIINIMIFAAFVNQGKLNCKEDSTFKETNIRWLEVLTYNGHKKGKERKKYLPPTPNQHYAKVYGKKGTLIALTTFASLFSVTYMVLNWDLVTFLSITITIILAIVFGIISMHKEEIYWLSDFKVRVDIEYEKMKMEEKQNGNN